MAMPPSFPGGRRWFPASWGISRLSAPPSEVCSPFLGLTPSPGTSKNVIASRASLISIVLALPTLAGCGEDEAPPSAALAQDLLPDLEPTEAPPPPARDRLLVEAAIERTNHEVKYESGYVKLEYPGGDVPPGTGVCTDVVVRAYRGTGIDLQKRVHEDMLAAFDEYPANWGLTKPDSNIDHRRVPNLQKFFTRHGETRPKSVDAADYEPGDVVTWNVGRNKRSVDHIGVVSNVFNDEQTRYKVVHNIGEGPKLQDVLFDWPITGHYRYLPED